MISLIQLRVLIGATLLCFPLCFTFVWGNLSTYMFSFYYSRDMLYRHSPSPSWLYALFVVNTSLVTLPVDVIKNAVGHRLTVFLGITCNGLAYFLTYFSVQLSVWTTTLTLVILGGVGDGMLVAICLLYVAGWFQTNLGLATAIMLSSGGVGGVILNQIITAFINPSDEIPDSIVGDSSYFTQRRLIDRVPMAFFLLGGIITALQLIGFCLLKDPPKSADQSFEQYTKDPKDAEESSQHSYTSETGVHPNGCNGAFDKSLRQQNGSPPRASQHITDLQEKPRNSTTVKSPMTIVQVLQSESFYIICLVAISQAFGVTVVITFYKPFGQLWIHDDHFLATVGSCSALAAVFLQTAFGHLVDRFGLKNMLFIQLASESVLLATWFFTPQHHWWPYFLWTNALICIFNNYYIVVALSAVRLFGKRFYATNVGLLSIATIFGSLVGAPIATFLLSTFGWFLLFFITGCVTFTVMFLIITRLENC